MEDKQMWLISSALIHAFTSCRQRVSLQEELSLRGRQSSPYRPHLTTNRPHLRLKWPKEHECNLSPHRRCYHFSHHQDGQAGGEGGEGGDQVVGRKRAPISRGTSHQPTHDSYFNTRQPLKAIITASERLFSSSLFVPGNGNKKKQYSECFLLIVMVCRELVRWYWGNKKRSCVYWIERTRRNKELSSYLIYT